MKDSSIVIPECHSCPFCSYLAGSRPYTVVFRDSDIAILVTREQRGKPHLLVVPLKHVETILELSDDEATALALATRDAAKAIEATYSPEGISVWQNNGFSSRQAIAHVHFHVAGTLPEGGTKWGDVPELSVRETDAIVLKLRPSIVALMGEGLE